MNKSRLITLLKLFLNTVNKCLAVAAEDVWIKLNLFVIVFIRLIRLCLLLNLGCIYKCTQNSDRSQKGQTKES